MLFFFTCTSTLSFIIFLGQFIVKDRRFENYNLSILFLLLSAMQAQAALVASGLIFTLPSLFFLHLTTLYMIGVILYFAYFLVSLRREVLPNRKYLLFLPAILAFGADTVYLFLPNEDKNLLLMNLFSGIPYEFSAYSKALIVGAGLQATIYLLLLMVKILRNLKIGKVVHLPGITIFYIVSSIVTFGILIVGYLISSITLFITGSTIIGLLITVALLISQRNPEFFQLVVVKKLTKPYSRSQLGKIETQDLHKRLTELIENEKIYVDEELSLVSLAEELSVTPHQMSEFLNSKMNANFHTFINQCRIKEAQQILIDEPDRTILSIAHAVGFNSKSSFYDAFRRSTGMSPNLWRVEALRNKNLRH
ncbi:DNA-binding helix-turn-helix protein [Leptospira fainei serovar Hurstbridge str. BUT 6]|uniref:DNA-binding helix-turn-helix protein n=2 Tax=Leptospira fainei TaxID=48782 RepID=S3V1E7_9LEPT|nr:DNA-binding helix-turn-helix protein [Leptospira fainei serovar Hurstbridge str. BUT 6]